MRVCLLIPVLDAFKGANHLPLLAAMKDVQFTILTNRMKPKDAVLPANVKVEALGGRMGPFYYGCSDYLFARSVLRHHPVRDPFWKQFDVLYLNQTMGPALLRLQQTGIQLSFLIHHPVSVDCALAIEESSFVSGILWRLKYALLVRWQKKFCHVLPHIITVSNTAADRIAQDYDCDRSKIAVVPNGVDGAVFTPGDLSQTSYDIIAVGSLVHPRKGFRYLAEIYRLLTAKGFRIADVGRRSEEQEAVLRTIQGVTRFGTVPDEKLLELLRSSAVLISSSLYEGFGLSLIEALACGRPAFAFEAGATGEVLKPIDPSLVVPQKDTQEIVRRVEDFLKLPTEERKQKGERYREDVLRRYSLNASAEKLREVYGNMPR